MVVVAALVWPRHASADDKSGPRPPSPRLLWQLPGSVVAAAPNGVVIARAPSNRWVAVEGPTGKELWSRPAPKSNPKTAVIGERLLAWTRDGKLSAYSLRDGHVLFERDTKCTPVIAIQVLQGSLIQGCLDRDSNGAFSQQFAAFRLEDGAERWRQDLRSGEVISIGDEHLIVSRVLTDRVTLRSIDVHAGGERWYRDLMLRSKGMWGDPRTIRSRYTSVLGADVYVEHGVIIVAAAGQLQGFSASDARLIWFRNAQENAASCFRYESDFFSEPGVIGCVRRGAVERLDVMTGTALPTVRFATCGAKEMRSSPQVFKGRGRLVVAVSCESGTPPLDRTLLVTWDGGKERLLAAPDIVEWHAELFGNLLMGGVEWGPLSAYSLAAQP